ncbi:MAG: hypothetical protein AB1505_14425 [Candidatus Latescibacterota bacterium]
MSVYKPCDIRGPVEELDADLYRAWGDLLAGRLEAGALFVVGGDVRLSTPGFQESLVQGLVEGGARVVDLGCVPTPWVYFARRHLGARGCAIVTASHSPPQVNGLKWMVGPLPPTQGEVQDLRCHTEAHRRVARGGGGCRAEDVGPAYRAWLGQRWGDARSRARVVLDPGGGAWAGRAAACLAAAFPGVGVTAIHDEPDGTFSRRHPDTARPQHLRALSEAVCREAADLGVAFDGDGDRLALVDGEGVVLSAEQVACILISSFGEEWAGRVGVHDVKCSDQVPAAIRQRGGRPLAQRSGHAFIRTSMMQCQGLFGTEISGHFFHGELDGGDDALFTACRFLWHMARQDTSAAELRRGCPAIHATPDLRVNVPPEDQEEAVEGVRRAFGHLPQSGLDGVRVEFPGGWALVRSSVTDAQLTFRFEGRTPDGLEEIVQSFAARLGSLGQAVQAQHEGEKAGSR